MAVTYSVVHTRPDTSVAWIADEDPDFIANFKAKTNEYIASGHIISFTDSHPSELEHHATLVLANEAAEDVVINDPNWRIFGDTIWENYQPKNITTVQTRSVD